MNSKKKDNYFKITICLSDAMSLLKVMKNIEKAVKIQRNHWEEEAILLFKLDQKVHYHLNVSI